jgi:hypothetical protein
LTSIAHILLAIVIAILRGLVAAFLLLFTKAALIVIAALAVVAAVLVLTGVVEVEVFRRKT